MSDATNPATIGALSRRTGSKVETIRYYERVGLLPKPPRSAGGYRLYGDDHRRRLAFIRRSRELGFTLEQIRALLRLADGPRRSCAQVRTLTAGHLVGVRGRIADLRRLERVLRDMVAACDLGSVPDCPVIEALSREAS